VSKASISEEGDFLPMCELNGGGPGNSDIFELSKFV